MQKIGSFAVFTSVLYTQKVWGKNCELSSLCANSHSFQKCRWYFSPSRISNLEKGPTYARVRQNHNACLLVFWDFSTQDVLDLMKNLPFNHPSLFYMNIFSYYYVIIKIAIRYLVQNSNSLTDYRTFLLMLVLRV